jgi:hypothetical protein
MKKKKVKATPLAVAVVRYEGVVKASNAAREYWSTQCQEAYADMLKVADMEIPPR